MEDVGGGRWGHGGGSACAPEEEILSPVFAAVATVAVSPVVGGVPAPDAPFVAAAASPLDEEQVALAAAPIVELRV